MDGLFLLEGRVVGLVEVLLFVVGSRVCNRRMVNLPIDLLSFIILLIMIVNIEL